MIGAYFNKTGIHQVVFCHVQGDCDEISQILFTEHLYIISQAHMRTGCDTVRISHENTCTL